MVIYAENTAICSAAKVDGREMDIYCPSHLVTESDIMFCFHDTMFLLADELGQEEQVRPGKEMSDTNTSIS